MKKVALFILVLVMVSSLAAAFSLDDIRYGTTDLGVYDRHKELLDFGIFFVLFLAVSWIGVRSFHTRDDQRNAAAGIAIVVAVALTIGALKAGLSPSFLAPFMKYVVFFLGVGLLYLLFVRMFGIESGWGRFWSLLFALLGLWFLFGTFNFMTFDRVGSGPATGGTFLEQAKDYGRSLMQAPTEVEGEKEPSTIESVKKKSTGILTKWKNKLVYKECKTNAECDGVCIDVGTMKGCVECSADTHCSAGEVCSENRCTKAKCTKGEVCASRDGKHAICKVGKGKEEGLCRTVECTTDQHCTKSDKNKVCIKNECKVASCKADSDCSGDQQCVNACNDANNDACKKTICKAAECKVDADCSSTEGCSGGKCVLKEYDAAGYERYTDMFLPGKHLFTGKSVKECAEKCTDEPSCTGFVFAKVEDTQECVGRTTDPDERHDQKNTFVYIRQDEEIAVDPNVNACHNDIDCPDGTDCDADKEICVEADVSFDDYLIYNNQNIAGEDLFVSHRRNSCAALCYTKGDKCKAFVWNEEEQKCYGRGGDATTPDSGVISYVKLDDTSLEMKFEGYQMYADTMTYESYEEKKKLFQVNGPIRGDKSLAEVCHQRCERNKNCLSFDVWDKIEYDDDGNEIDRHIGCSGSGFDAEETKELPGDGYTLYVNTKRVKERKKAMESPIDTPVKGYTLRTNEGTWEERKEEDHLFTEDAITVQECADLCEENDKCNSFGISFTLIGGNKLPKCKGSEGGLGDDIGETVKGSSLYVKESAIKEEKEEEAKQPKINTEGATLIAPSPGDTISTSSVNFLWNEVENAQWYILIVADGHTEYYRNRVEGSSQLVQNIGLIDDELKVTLETFVKAGAEKGKFVQNVYKFKTEKAPFGLEIHHPDPNEPIKESSAKFVWTKANAKAYTLILTDGETVFHNERSTKNEQEVVGIPLGKDVKAAIIAHYEVGEDVKKEYTYTTIAKPRPPTLIHPTPGLPITTNEVEFRWEDVPGATEYILKVDAIDKPFIGDEKIIETITPSIFVTDATVSIPDGTDSLLVWLEARFKGTKAEGVTHRFDVDFGGDPDMEGYTLKKGYKRGGVSMPKKGIKACRDLCNNVRPDACTAITWNKDLKECYTTAMDDDHDEESEVHDLYVRGGGIKDKIKSLDSMDWFWISVLGMGFAIVLLVVTIVRRRRQHALGTFEEDATEFIEAADDNMIDRIRLWGDERD